MLVFGAPNYLNLLSLTERVSCTYSLLTPEHPTGKGHEGGKAGVGTRKQVTGAVSARGRRRLQKSHPGRVAHRPERGQRANVTAAGSQVGPGKTWGWSPHYTSCHPSCQPRGGLGARRARVALTPPNRGLSERDLSGCHHCTLSPQANSRATAGANSQLFRKMHRPWTTGLPGPSPVG